LRSGYPMLVIPTVDRDNYLAVLQQCDKNTCTSTFGGANATIEQVVPLVDYIKNFVEKKLILSIQFAKGEIMSFFENSVVEKNAENKANTKSIGDNVVGNVVEHVPDNDPEKTINNQHDKNLNKKHDPEHDPDKFIERRQKVILDFIKMNNKISAKEISELLKTNSRTIQRDLQKFKERGIIERVGGDRGGYWKIVKTS